MATEDLRFIPIGQFLGDDESVPSIGLPAAYSSGGSRNIWIDQYGRATSILGYSKTNPVAIVSNTGGAAMRVRALYHYVLRVGTAVTRQELAFFDDGAAHFELRMSVDSGASWVFLFDFGPANCNTVPDFSQSGNVLVMTNGVFTPQQWDGTTLTAAVSSQLAAPTVVSAGVGALVGSYKYRVVPIKTDGTRKVASVASAPFAASGDRLSPTWVADPDVTVGSYEIYRSTGTGVQMYFVSSVVGRLTVTLASDNLADEDLFVHRALQEYGDVPPVGSYFAELHTQRLWYGRTDTDPRRWYYADVGLPFSVFKDFAYFDMTDAEAMSDVSVGATGNFRSMFVVWLERSVWRISGTGRVDGAVTDYNRKRTSARTGTVSHRTVARIPKGAKYLTADGNLAVTSDVTLAYLTPFADVRLFDGDNDEIISAAKATTLARLNYAQRRKAYCVQDTPRNEVTWVFPADTASEPSYAVTWNYAYGVWYDRSWAFGFAIETEAADDASILIGGESDTSKGGYTYLLWDGTTFDGAAIAWSLMTKTLYGTGDARSDATGTGGASLLSYLKRWRWADILFLTTGKADLTIEWLPGEAPDLQVGDSTVVTPIGSIITDAEGNAIITSDGSLLYTTLTPSVLRASFFKLVSFQNGLNNRRYQHARGMRMRVSCASTTVVVSIIGINIAYQLLAGLKRTFRR